MPDNEKSDSEGKDLELDEKTEANEPKEPKEQTYELTVDGEKRSVTLDEMRELAQKSAGANKRFEDASSMRKEAEKGLRISSLIESLSDNPDESEAKELAALLGLDPQEFVSWMKEEEKTPPQKKSGAKTISKDDLAVGLKELGLDPAEVKNILEFSRQRHIAAAKEEIIKKSDEAVDKDKIFGKMIVGENRDDRLAVIKEMVAEDVLERLRDGAPFGTDLLAASIQKVRAYLTKFGIPSKPAEYPITMGLGPGQGLPAEFQSDEPIKRISAAEDKDEKNLIARFMQRNIKKLRERGR